ncbi:hypothetical protein S40285_10809, partial [Stachybotrys chlorohalonatus IBT 40285]
MMTHV